MTAAGVVVEYVSGVRRSCELHPSSTIRVEDSPSGHGLRYKHPLRDPNGERVGMVPRSEPLTIAVTRDELVCELEDGRVIRAPVDGRTKLVLEGLTRTAGGALGPGRERNVFPLRGVSCIAVTAPEEPAA